MIGVNSIFLTTENSKDFEICEDVCKNYKWLDSLEKLRKITAFGYIYCCEVTKELKHKLDGFPMEIRPVQEITKVKESSETNEITKLATEEEVESNEESEADTTTPEYDEDYGNTDYE